MPTETIITLIISFLATLGLGGVLGVFLQRRFEQQKQTNEHDVKIFNQSNEILNEKKLVSSILDFQLIGSHRIKDEDYYLLKRWHEYFEQTGNKYLNKKISIENQRLYNEIGFLIDFIGKNFEILDGQNLHNTNSYLRPDLDPDRMWNEENIIKEQVYKYEKYAEELKNLAKSVRQLYSRYRLVIKNNLKI